ncbi:MAG: hypothetical protein GX639_20185 [Fibrobacter sp.]|nr:hypothetical protein [Fibrobacter sp.]
MGSLVPQQNLNLSSIVKGFKLDRVEPISELHATAYIFTHQKTGARVLHLYNDDPNNLFSIAFRTPVSDSTGVPHIMEHSVLCGSKKFPIKDPFQELLKGSLQTFLNALTYPDKTIYPVSSQVEKDFFNLVDVYCDAVFNPLITENTFYQEGWHFDVEDVNKDVGIKGIVYNEMKGVFSNFSSHVDRRTLSTLFPDISYSYESGGDPEHITDLTYEQFREFHRKYYHPSNSFIFLYGNLSSEKTLGFLNDQYLDNYSFLDIDSRVNAQALWSTPKNIRIKAPAPKEDDGTATVALVWIFGDATDPVLTLSGRILSHYLLGTESSPLKRALVDSGLGEDLDDISGFETDLVQTVFAAGLRKSTYENAAAIEKLILDTLQSEIEKGFDRELMDGSIRQIEFGLREITGSHFPYNLRLAERCYRSWIYDGDPLAHLAFEKPLAFIKDEFAKGPEFFRTIVRKHLLDNNHRLCAVIEASSEMGKKLEQQTVEQAKKLTNGFTSVDKEKYHALTNELLLQQKTPPSEAALATLPKLSKSDLPLKGKETPAIKEIYNGATVFTHPVFTSGVVYFDIGFNLQCLPQRLIPYLSIYAELITRCGTNGYSYEDNAKRIALATGGIDASVSCKTMPGTDDSLFFYGFLHGKAIAGYAPEMLGIIFDLLSSPDLTNVKQIKDILLEERNGLHASVVGSGHQFAISYASSFVAKSRYLDELMGGITQLRFLDTILKNNTIDDVVNAIKEIHALVVNRNAAFVSVTADDPSQILQNVKGFIDNLPGGAFNKEHYSLPESTNAGALGIEINSAVNFVSKIWKMPPQTPQSFGIQYLISRYLSTGYLWDKVRVEGGAYGGMSVSSVAHPVFACASYRDPNLGNTLHHFEKGLQMIAAGINQDKIDQNIIGAVGKIDSPLSPHAQGFGEAVDQMIGQTAGFRQKVRESILTADSEKLRSIAESILNSKESIISVIGGSAAFDIAEKDGHRFNREPLIP